ncbi:class I SAM-dependent methyltransferase [Prevotella falsenii]|uniref:class I SAM-dependent methyltransferase n=1 Tax=Prevotella falsenii TaxID=515414 RepID=UPI00055E2D23|nr:methyltransferase domain-containing protein [Prevotella falsenii]
MKKSDTTVSIKNYSNESKVIKCYKRYAPLYDLLFGRVFQQGRRAIIKEMKGIGTKDVLEVGVGTGLMLPMYPQDVTVTGVDISKEMLDKAQEKVDSSRTAAVSLMQVNGEQLPFPDNHFTCITLPYTYSVTPDPIKLIKEVRRVCKKDGFIIIANHFSGVHSPWAMFEKIVSPFATKIGFQSEFSYQTYVENLNWNVVKSYSCNLFGLSRIVVVKND